MIEQNRAVLGIAERLIRFGLRHIPQDDLLHAVRIENRQEVLLGVHVVPERRAQQPQRIVVAQHLVHALLRQAHLRIRAGLGVFQQLRVLPCMAAELIAVCQRVFPQFTVFRAEQLADDKPRHREIKFNAQFVDFIHSIHVPAVIHRDRDFFGFAVAVADNVILRNRGKRRLLHQHQAQRQRQQTHHAFHQQPLLIAGRRNSVLARYTSPCRRSAS